MHVKYFFYFFTKMLKQNMLTNVKICKTIFFTFDFVFLKRLIENRIDTKTFFNEF
jgi:hypothetical protein